MTGVRIGIVGCGQAAQAHLDRLIGLDGVSVVGCADPDLAAAESLSARAGGGPAAASFADHGELLRKAAPDAVMIFTPHLAHYRPAMDALQAGCHVFIENPVTTDAQEAVDLVRLARGRNRLVGVGHEYRLLPSLAEARRRLAAGDIGTVRLVAATMAQPWLEDHSGRENSWRFDPKAAGAGVLADSGGHLIDALLWSTGRAAESVSAVQVRMESGLDLVTAASIRLADGTPATVGLSGVSSAFSFELTYFGEAGSLRCTLNGLYLRRGRASSVPVPLPGPAGSIDGDFVAAVRTGSPLCCPAEEATGTVRVLEAMARSASSGQLIRLN